MNRIVIVGSDGSSKSTLAKQMGLALGLEVTHLDSLFWKPGWVRVSAAEQEAIVSEIVSHASWVIDGDHVRTQPARFGAADTIVFLDFPRGICMWRTIRRFFHYRGQSRVGMAAGCSERLNLMLLRWVWRYPLDNRAPTLANIARWGGGCRVVTLRSPQEVRRFLDALPSERDQGFFTGGGVQSRFNAGLLDFDLSGAAGRALGAADGVAAAADAGGFWAGRAGEARVAAG